MAAAREMEPDMPIDDEFDVQTIDLKTLTPAQWDALKRRAHAERSRVIGQILARAVSWLRGRAQTSKPHSSRGIAGLAHSRGA